uniref:NADH-ubiquinone oxidoreductase chain 4L n=1 Tax=Rhineura floridana TaxID=261503 RepID=Q66SY7_RHIFL|nr:NADH dehydrogenase subunit 4L [Rhineura floridana]AAT08498.1 NADH dehydrogenase subunit 4L [Rhineura floridana]
MSPINLMLTMSFIFCLLGLATHRSHFVSALLCLEGMMLTLYILISMFTLNTLSTSSSINPIILLTLSACEAAVGLAILVTTSHTHGSDNLKTMSLLKC